MGRLLFGFITLTVSSLVAAQTPILGMTRAEVLAQLGEPTMVSAPKLGNFYPAAQRLQLEADGYVVDDIFTVQRGGLEFRLRAGYSPDFTTSRLHPTDRLRVLTYTPDKNLSVQIASRALPEFRLMCGVACDMLFLTSGSEYQLFIYPSKPTAGDIALASNVATGFKESTSENFHWRPAMIVRFQERRSVSDRGSLPDPSTLKVDSIDIGAADPGFEKQMARGLFHEEKNLQPAMP